MIPASPGSMASLPEVDPAQMLRHAECLFACPLNGRPLGINAVAVSPAGVDVSRTEQVSLQVRLQKLADDFLCAGSEKDQPAFPMMLGFMGSAGIPNSPRSS